jgi:hypothetical protein
MLKVLALAPALLAACSTAPADPPIHGVTPGHKCETDGTDQFIGQSESSATGAAIKRASHAAVLRWAPPGVMLTMDYRDDRVTVHVGPDKKITEIKCG